MEGNKDSLRNIWDKIKHINIHITVVLEGEDRDRPEKMFEEVTGKKFHNMGKEILKSRKHKVSHTR